VDIILVEKVQICKKSTIFGESFSLSLTLNHADSVALFTLKYFQIRNGFSLAELEEGIGRLFSQLC
jgi:hypothetical protein